MNSGYTKLFGSIVGSTIWGEDDKTRIVWITMLAMKNQHGEVEASIPGLAKFAQVSIDDTEKALAKLLSPDPYSRSKEHEGRRIAEIDGGWIVLNHWKSCAKASEDDKLEQARIRQQRFRQRNALRNAAVTHSNAPSRTVTPNNAIQIVDKDNNTLPLIARSAVASTSRTLRLVDDSDVLRLKQDPSLKGVNLEDELAACRRWCDANGKKPTLKRFTNWLNKAAKQARLRAETQRTRNSPAPLPVFTETRQLKPEEM